jgi:predicted enzyme related to lactoylglutathione lyase
MSPGILINIDVDDLERGIAFYAALLDLRIRRRFGSSGIELLGGAPPLYLLVKQAGTAASPASGERRRYGRHWTPVRLDFVVPDLDNAVAAAVAAGETLDDPPPTHNWGRIAHLAGPFGSGFCLIQFLGRGARPRAADDGSQRRIGP